MLLDLMMPQMSGYEVLDEMAKLPCEERPIIIVLTAGSEPRSLPANLVSGTVRKPFDIAMLVDTVAACLSTITEFSQQKHCPPAESDTIPAEPNVARNNAN
jgi:CheY-like chemotaxis protein